MDETTESVLAWMKRNTTAIEKARIGTDGKSVLFKDAHGATMEFIPANENGKPHIAKKVFGTVSSPAAFQEAINKAQGRYSCNEDYDEFLMSSTQFQAQFAQPKTIIAVRHIFESIEDVAVAIKNEGEMMAIIDHVRNFSEIFEEETNGGASWA